MPKMTTYIVYRHGSNAANQSRTQVMVVGFEDAPDRETAKEQMAQRIEVYNNQHLTAKPASRASKTDCAHASVTEYGREQREAAVTP